MTTIRCRRRCRRSHDDCGYTMVPAIGIGGDYDVDMAHKENQSVMGLDGMERNDANAFVSISYGWSIDYYYYRCCYYLYPIGLYRNV